MLLIARIKGGLGNQLFCYAAARRLALINGAELILDSESGFKRDHQYQRKYMLQGFNIPARLATPGERLEPLERMRRAVWKYTQRRKPFGQRSYIEQEFGGYDQRLIDLKLSASTTYLDGLWQSALYFGEIESTLRQDLFIHPPTDSQNLKMAEKISECNAVAIHVRWFQSNDGPVGSNATVEYYKKAIDILQSSIQNTHFFVFSDKPEAAIKQLSLQSNKVTFVCHNNNNINGALWDMWLMTLCDSIIMANSTFSWWGAWLGSTSRERKVLFPRLKKSSDSWAWDYQGQMPDNWIPIIL